MQILLIFDPVHRVKNISFSSKHLIFIGLFLLVILAPMSWIWNSASGVVKEALHTEALKRQGLGDVSASSEAIRETKLIQLRIHLDLLQDKFDQLTLAKGGPLRSYGASGSIDQSESYEVRLDRAYSESIALDSRLDTFQKEQKLRLGATNTMPTASPLPIPLKASSSLGYRIDPFTNQMAWHQGVDFQAAYGTPILATGSGKVIRATWDSDYGFVIDIQHQHSVITRYAHAQVLLVKQGDWVSKSQMIARVGSTGRSTGPHLHYEVLKDIKNLAKG